MTSDLSTPSLLNQTKTLFLTAILLKYWIIYFRFLFETFCWRLGDRIEVVHDVCSAGLFRADDGGCRRKRRRIPEFVGSVFTFLKFREVPGFADRTKFWIRFSGVVGRIGFVGSPFRGSVLVFRAVGCSRFTSWWNCSGFPGRWDCSRFPDRRTETIFLRRQKLSQNSGSLNAGTCKRSTSRRLMKSKKIFEQF